MKNKLIRSICTIYFPTGSGKEMVYRFWSRLPLGFYVVSGIETNSWGETFSGIDSPAHAKLNGTPKRLYTLELFKEGRTDEGCETCRFYACWMYQNGSGCDRHEPEMSGGVLVDNKSATT